jgi:hypothetical protein
MDVVREHVVFGEPEPERRESAEELEHRVTAEDVAGEGMSAGKVPHDVFREGVPDGREVARPHGFGCPSIRGRVRMLIGMTVGTRLEA